MPTITGTDGPETLVGTPDQDLIDALGGDDTVDETVGSGSGADQLDGGSGYDTLILRDAAEWLDMRSGLYRGYDTSISTFDMPQTTASVKGFEHVIASGQNQVELTADDSGVWFELPPPTTYGFVLYSYTLTGGAGDDRLEAPLSADGVFDGGAGDDLLIPGYDSHVRGGTGHDTFRFQDPRQSPATRNGFPLYVTIEDFQSGADKVDLTTIAGPEVLIEHEIGFTYLTFAQAQSSVYLSYGYSALATPLQIDDALSSTPTHYTLRGLNLGTGSDLFLPMDTLVGGAGGDTIQTGTAGAYVRAGLGADTLVGNTNYDVFIYNDAAESTRAAPDHISGFTTRQDVVDLTAADLGRVRMTYDDHQTFIDFGAGSGDSYTGHLVVDGSLVGPDLRASFGILVQDGDYPDLLIGGPAPDVISGGGGDDVIEGGRGPDILSGGEGRDLFRYTDVLDSHVGADDVITDFQSRADSIDLTQVDGGKVLLTFDDHKSFLHFAPDAQGVYQGLIAIEGDVVEGFDLRISGALTIADGDYGDRLTGGTGDDVITGAGGADLIEGSYGADQLTGGPGADIFRYTDLRDSLPNARDVITDFNPAEGDVIDLSVIDANPATPADDAFTFVAAFDSRPGEAVLSYDASLNVSTLSLDVTGDGAADFALIINGHPQPDTGFLL